MRSVWQAVAFLFIVVFISLIYKLPAKFVYQQFASNSPVHLSGISGSIWSGHVEQIEIQQLVLKNLDWQLSPFALLLARADIQWRLNDEAAPLSGEVVVSSSRLMINNLQGYIDLLAIAQRLPRQDIIAGGTVNLKDVELEIEQEKIMHAAGRIHWQQAELLSPENIVLGGFNADLNQKDGDLLIQLMDTGGAVSLVGDIQFSLDGQFEYLMKVAVRDTSATGLLDAFNQLGQTDENGKVTLQDRGNVF